MSGNVAALDLADAAPHVPSGSPFCSAQATSQLWHPMHALIENPKRYCSPASRASSSGRGSDGRASSSTGRRPISTGTDASRQPPPRRGRRARATGQVRTAHGRRRRGTARCAGRSAACRSARPRSACRRRRRRCPRLSTLRAGERVAVVDGVGLPVGQHEHGDLRRRRRARPRHGRASAAPARAHRPPSRVATAGASRHAGTRWPRISTTAGSGHAVGVVHERPEPRQPLRVVERWPPTRTRRRRRGAAMSASRSAAMPSASSITTRRTWSMPPGELALPRRRALEPVGGADVPHEVAVDVGDRAWRCRGPRRAAGRGPGACRRCRRRRGSSPRSVAITPTSLLCASAHSRAQPDTASLILCGARRPR